MSLGDDTETAVAILGCTLTVSAGWAGAVIGYPGRFAKATATERRLDTTMRTFWKVKL